MSMTQLPDNLLPNGRGFGGRFSADCGEGNTRRLSSVCVTPHAVPVDDCPWINSLGTDNETGYRAVNEQLREKLHFGLCRARNQPTAR